MNSYFSLSYSTKAIFMNSIWCPYATHCFVSLSASSTIWLWYKMTIIILSPYLFGKRVPHFSHRDSKWLTVNVNKEILLGNILHLFVVVALFSVPCFWNCRQVHWLGASRDSKFSPANFISVSQWFMSNHKRLLEMTSLLRRAPGQLPQMDEIHFTLNGSAWTQQSPGCCFLKKAVWWLFRRVGESRSLLKPLKETLAHRPRWHWLQALSSW